MFNFLSWISVITSLLHLAASTTYFVSPADHHPLLHYSNKNTFTLQHYLNNTNEYFASHNQLHFLPGHYYIHSDLVFKDIVDFTLTGHGINQSFIVCPSPARLVMTNVDDFVFQNISLIGCMTLSETDASTKSYYYVSVFLYRCGSVVLHNLYVNLSVSAPVGLTAIHVRNVAKTRVINVQVQLNVMICASIKVNGLAVYYSSSNDKTYYMRQPNVIVENFQYHTQKSCLKFSQCAIAALLVRISEFFHFVIRNTVFTNLSNSSAFCYYAIADSNYEDATMRSVLIKNVTVCNNTGYNHSNMFQFELYSFDSSNSEETLSSLYYNGPVRLYNMLSFENCNFTRNANIDAMIYVRPSTDTKIEGYITVSHSTFHNNKNVNFIKVARESENIPNVITHVTLEDVTVSCNNHHYDGNDLILITNGRLFFSNIVFSTNHNYENLINLRSSMLYFKHIGSNRILKNYARHIIKAQGSSFLFIDCFAMVNISKNVVYKVVRHVSSLETSVVPVCPLQVYDHDSENDNPIDDLGGINCTFLLINNTEMISKFLPSEITTFINETCVWLESTFFKKINNTAVYHKVMKFNKIFINKSSERFVPLSVCPCLQNGSYSCYTASLGSLFPGQTLRIKLIISQRWSNLSSTIIVANTKDDDCIITDSNQLSQSHLQSHECNDYSYTIWPNSKFITECKLFVGLNEMPEMFFVQMKPCPVGFTLQSSKKSCYCDPWLNNNILSVTSCNLDDETVLRPANSWISADSKNNSYTYMVSPQCPFDYCLPYSSHLNLSNPDSQCQFNRSGVVCAVCKQGLSTVFGSSYCKHCTSLYLFIIVPIAIAGIVLVIMLFTFNLTVTNGIINTLIFYVNIISINYSQFCFDSHSPDCIILSLFNLDLGIETCFYDGMDGYTKMWLQLVFPSYLMIIAFTLIIGSRYSSSLQRFTGTKVLKVLATLFLLSYTKILLTVCQVLFFFSSVTHLPSKETTLVWSIDTGVKLFGVKFCILYSVCLIIFIILLIFNFLLLFPRTASRWSFINYFKPLLDAYFGPYKQNYAFWTGLQLLIRSCFFGLSALTRNTNLSIGAVLVGLVLCAHGIFHPFQSRFKNFQESLVLFNLLAVYVTALHTDNENSKHKFLIVRLLIISVLAYYIILIFCHCVMLRCGDTIKSKANKFKRMLMKGVTIKQTFSESLDMDQVRSKIPDVAFNYKEFQEPIVALD